jgi:hypothetical protein
MFRSLPLSRPCSCSVPCPGTAYYNSTGYYRLYFHQVLRPVIPPGTVANNSTKNCRLKFDQILACTSIKCCHLPVTTPCTGACTSTRYCRILPSAAACNSIRCSPYFAQVLLPLILPGTAACNSIRYSRPEFIIHQILPPAIKYNVPVFPSGTPVSNSTMYCRLYFRQVLPLALPPGIASSNSTSTQLPPLLPLVVTACYSIRQCRLQFTRYCHL